MKRKRLMTPYQRALDAASIIMCLIAAISTAVRYSSLPDMLPSHFDSAGNITGYQGKSTLFMLVFFVFLITAIFAVLLRVNALYEVMSTPWPIPKGRELEAQNIVKDMLAEFDALYTFMFADLVFSVIHSYMHPLLIWLPIGLSGVSFVMLFVRLYRLRKKPKDKEPWE